MNQNSSNNTSEQSKHIKDQSDFPEYYEHIQPQIEQLATLMLDSTNELQLTNIEELTKDLFSDVEKLDSENLIILNAYKVIARAFFMINHQQDISSSGEYKITIDKDKVLQQDKENERLKMIHQQNEELLACVTKNIESQQERSEVRQKLRKTENDFHEYVETVGSITNEIATNLNHSEISDLNELNQVIKEYVKTKEEKIQQLQNDLDQARNQLQEATQNEETNSKYKKAYQKMKKENAKIKSDCETLTSQNSQLMNQIQSDVPNYMNQERDFNDILRKEINNITNKCIEAQNSVSKLEEEKEILTHQISQKNELINKLAKDKEKLENFAKSNLFTNEEQADTLMLQAELELMRTQYNEVKIKNEQLQSKIKQLLKVERKVNQLIKQIKRKDEENKFTINKLTIENDELRSKISDNAECNLMKSEVQSKSTEIKNLMMILDKLSNQLEDQGKEISEENKIKSTLLSIIEKQSVAITQYESIIMNKNENESNSQMEIAKLSSLLASSKQQIQDKNDELNSLFNDLLQFSKTEVQGKLSNDLILLLKDREIANIVPAFKMIGKQIEIEKNENEKIQNEKTTAELHKHYNYILSIIRTLRTIADKTDDDSDEKEQILKDCRKVNSFVYENAPGLIEEPTIFDAFGIHVDESRFISEITSFVNKFRDVESEEAKELFSILKYIIVMNTILRKTAEGFKEQCEMRSFEVKKLKNQIINMKHEFELEEEQKRIERETNQEIQNQIERKQIEEEQKLIEGHNNAEYDQLKDAFNKLQVDYNELKKKYHSMISKMKNKISLLNKQNQKLAASNHNLTETTSKHSDELEALNQTLKDEISQREMKLEALNQSLKDEIAQQEMKLETSSNIIKDLQFEIESLQKALIEQKEDLQHNYEQLFKKYKQESNENIKSLKMEQQKDNQKLQQAKNAILSLNQDLHTEKERNSQLKANYENIIQNVREKLQQSRSNEIKMRSEFNSKEGEINDYKSQLSSLTVENKLLKMKISTLEQQATREKSFNVNQSIAQQIATEHQIASKINESQEKMKRKEQHFLSTLCEILHEYVDENEEVTHESIKRSAKYAIDDIGRLRKAINDYKNIANEMTKIRNSVSPDRSKSTFEAIQQILKEKDDLENEVNQKVDNQSPSTSQIWESWARRVYTISTDTTSSIMSSKELRQKLEEIVLNSLGMRNNNFTVESLRKQKQILLSRQPLSPKKNDPSIKVLLIVQSTIRRMQKMSGHLHSNLVIPKSDVTDTFKSTQAKHKNDENETPKNFALFNSID